MNIIEAAKTEKRIRHENWEQHQYIYWNAKLQIWIDENEDLYKFDRYDFCSVFWEVYEPEKCEACKDAQQISYGGTFNTEVADHLRKYHCTCGEA